MAKQPTGGSSRGQARGGGTTQSRGSRSGAGGTQRGTGRGAQNTSQTTSQNTSQNTSRNAAQSIDQNSQQRDDRQMDQERQLNVSREGGGGSATSVRGGDGRSGQRGNMISQGQGQEQTSILPVLMSNPWLMTNAFLTNPFGFTQAMNQEMDRLFGNDDIGSFGRIGQGSSGQQGQGRGLATIGGQGSQRGRGLSRWAPQIEVRQRGNELTVCADLPGMTPDDIDVHIEDGMLTISGERQSNTEDNQEGVYRSERSYGAFTRTIPLPEGVSEDNVRARFEHGVLEVTVPLPQQQQQRGRRIQIQSGAGRSNAQAGQIAQGGQSTQGGQGAQSGQSAQSGQGNQSNQSNQGREGRQQGANAS